MKQINNLLLVMGVWRKYEKIDLLNYISIFKIDDTQTKL